MLGLIQRVSEARVVVKGNTVAEVGPGLLLLLGIEQSDSETEAVKLVNRVLNYRVFNDDLGHMNLSLLDVIGELLVVSQFTLAATTNKGLRPSFSSAASPEDAQALYDFFVRVAAQRVSVQTGHFGADMQVSLVNDGPATFILSA
ncbi:MAG TPA: D-tyrosyl-tRNA(Tyr) deacylase [Gammaproteobacteria bacterium]|nr:D-tyrosyl-tRNA(Tyr) deacylase [Gammaproteobacteria bacterium]|tara:strand:- start:1463 stop:1897 length:435 start_codon:yes stop_codon:yes gene_type:complete